MRELYLGLISGTSIDGVNVVLTELDDSTARVLRGDSTPFPATLRERLQRIVENPQTTLQELGSLDRAVGLFFAECAQQSLERAGIPPANVRAIGHHGQTVFHLPDGPEPFTMQIGDPNVVAAITGLTTVADFRRLDMALGGQGAPLVPAFHAACFGSASEARTVVNIGGIANVTLLDPGRPPRGFDTGPGNTLLDLWIRRCHGQSFDRDGRWAASGNVNDALLARLLAEPYFALPGPKSTGRELFHMAWLDGHLQAAPRVEPADVQATLAELTAATIVRAVDECLPNNRRLLICGGGAHNIDLLERIRRRTSATVETTASHGVDPDWVEGAAFAWLARARLRTESGNVPTVTGARRPAVLGGVYWAEAP